MKAKSILKVEGLKKSFAGLKAVDDVSFFIETGEILGLIGPNGSGKTTTINIMTGMLDKDEGSVLIDGQDISDLPAYRASTYGLVRTYQTIRLFKNLSCLENAMMGAIGIGIKRRNAAILASEILDEIGLGGSKELPMERLSFRDQRLLEVARALAAKPKFMLLDEPAAGLNEEETFSLLSLLETLLETKNIGILIVDHDMRLIMNLCHRLHVLNYGRTIATGDPKTVKSNPEVIKAYLGSEAS